MPIIFLSVILVLLYCLEVIYFRIANRFNIIDQPNHRSSHTAVTIRGGGIIFAIAALIFFFSFGFQYPFFILGLSLISFISFLDDIHTLNNKIRLAVQLLAVTLLFYQWNLFDLSFYWILLAAIFVLATINAYNFMDGINGITGLYSLLTIVTLTYINHYVISFTSSNFLAIIGLSLLVFNFFNFRKKAKCFAGDIGSVSIAFIIIFLIGQLIINTHNFSYILLLLCYGLDTAFTLIFRKIRKENIFEAHRAHFYQYMANNLKWPHLIVSATYFIVQLLINVIIIFVVKDSIELGMLLLVLTTGLFCGIRFLSEGKRKLLGK